MVAGLPADHHRPVNTIAATGPLDASGRLVHADDPAAQLALALARVEAVLGDHGRSATDLHALRVLTTDRAAAEAVLDVLTDRLADLGADLAVTVDDVPTLAVPGMVVAVEADVAPRLLVVVAHPDDEAFGCGSVLAHATRRGLRSTVVCATRGELGEPAPGSGLTAADLPHVRERELRQACALLGAEQVEVLGYLDSGVDGDPAPGSLAAAGHDELCERVVAILDDVRPDVVVTLDASDGHRDHAAMRDATRAAYDRCRHRPGALYLYCLGRAAMTEFTGVDSLGTPDEDVTHLVDVADLLDLRWAAIRAHASQVPPFDAMDEPLQREFLTVDRLLRLRPPWPGGPVATEWTPAPRLLGKNIDPTTEGSQP